jgi:hypothetical protein
VRHYGHLTSDNHGIEKAFSMRLASWKYFVDCNYTNFAK